MTIQHFFHAPTSTLTYVVHDGKSALVLDPVRDYDARSARTSWESAEEVSRYIDKNRLDLRYVVETHVHADHLSGVPYFREKYGARSVIGAGVEVVQRTFRDFYNLGPDFPADGSAFDLRLGDGEKLEVGGFSLEAIATPGHTPAHVSWRVGGAVFLGDTLFAPDYGTARCDFPGGSAEELYDSIQRLYALPESTRLYLCHDYKPVERPLSFVTTVGEQKEKNVHLNARTKKEDFVAFRTARDRELPPPELFLAALQVNIRAGRLPEPESNGISYLKIPVDRLGS